MKEVLKVDLDNAITDEDNIIHFTEQTVEDVCEVMPTEVVGVRTVMAPAAAARKIQRAWRKYMTLKVLKKYYAKEKKRENDKPGKEKHSDRKKEFERTLKIKKSN